MSTGMRARVRCVALAALAVGLVAPSAYATDGYFQYGYGARQKALGGAGVADSRDATAAALNPAGLVHVPDQIDVSVTAFKPYREVTGSGQPGFTPMGTVESGRNLFLVPNFAWSRRVHNNPLFDVAALTVYGNGGMNTSYPPVTRLRSCPNPQDPQGGPVDGSGVFCGGKMGVDLQQAFMSVALAKKIAPNLSIGVAPLLVRQQIKLQGIGAFAQASLEPGSVSNNGIDVSWGYGVRGGIEYALTPAIRIGIAGNTRVLMQDFEKYDGTFAEHGGFDIPASLQAGIAIDIRPDLTLMADYKYINYSGVRSIANPSENIYKCQSDPSYCLGGENGPGFGWRDVNVLKVGLEWRASPVAIWRLGYSYNQIPIKSADVMFNIIAPGVVQHHFTAGGEFKISDKWSLELAGAYVPESKVVGEELAGFGNPGHIVEISMHQYEVTAGLKYRFDAGPEPLK